MTNHRIVWRFAMKRNCFIVLCTLLALILFGGGSKAVAQDTTDNDFKRGADRLAIDKLTRDMIDAFDRRDASAIAARWTDDGEFRHNDDEPVRGRAEIQKGYGDFFKTLKGKPKLEIQSDDLRFPSADMAVKQTTLRMRSEEGEIVASGRQDTVLVREGGQWKVAIVRESGRDIGLDASLQELDWLIGTWHAATSDREVAITYEWDRNRTFIRGTFTVKEGSTVIDTGTEMIAKDNAKGVIRSWLFQSDGGFGGGVWAREGKTWRIHVDGVKPDGGRMTGTLVYVRVDPNAFTWQAVDLAHDGEPVADMTPIKVTRQRPAK
jgi:uncharacterized protein (TIGR02246 family)